MLEEFKVDSGMTAQTFPGLVHTIGKYKSSQVYLA